MKKSLPFVKLGRIWLMSCMLVFISHLSLPQNQPLAYSKSLPLDSGPQNRQELGTFLKQLEISHHIHFVYQKGLLDGKILDVTLMVADEDEAIEKILDKVLQPFHLQYKKLKGESAYAFYLSQDGQNWGEPVSKGAFANILNSPVLKRVRFEQSKQARYLKFESLEAASEPTSLTSVAELGVITKE